MITIQKEERKNGSRVINNILVIFVFSLLGAGSSIYSSLHQLTLTTSTDYFDFDIATIQTKAIDGVQDLWESLESTVGWNDETKSKTTGLPTLEELTRVNYTCPDGTEFFENVVLPESITHANRRIPNVVHVTAKTRCVSPLVKNHLQRWVFPNHSLYFHDDIAAYRLLNYAVKDANGHELIKGLSKQLPCISSGAAMSDMWRYVLLYHYGGVYTDLDNAPGHKYDVEHISPETDSFYFVEQGGFMSQYYMVSSKHHPMLLYMLYSAIRKVYNKSFGNVLKNMPPQTTGPNAVKVGYILFIRAAGGNTTGYDPAGIYYGSTNMNLTKELSWFGKGPEEFDSATLGEYAKPAEFENRSVTIMGLPGRFSKHWVDRGGLKGKGEAFQSMNMSHYLDKKLRKENPRTNQISCPHHVERMMNLTQDPSSFYFQKTRIQDLMPKYEFRSEEQHYFDTNTDEKVIPWSAEKKADFYTNGMGIE